jgi:hypothetical protein
LSPTRREFIGAAALSALACGESEHVRIDIGHNVGPGGDYIIPSPTTLATTLSASSFPADWSVRADLDVFLETGVSAWGDQSGTAHAVQSVRESQPAWLASAINGCPAVVADGADDFLEFLFTGAAPASQPFWVYLIAQQDSWTANDTLWSDGSSQLYQNTTIGGMRIYGGSANSSQNNNWTGFKRILCQFTGTAAAFLQIGGTTVTGNIGSAASGTVTTLFGAPGGVRPFNGRLAEAARGQGTLTTPARTAADAYVSGRYGASLLT